MDLTRAGAPTQSRVPLLMLLSDLLRYARVHKVGEVLAGVVAVALVSAVLGGIRLPLPSLGATGVATGVPFRRELPLLTAVFLAATLSGPMRDHEAAAGPRLSRVRAVTLTTLTAFTCAFSLLTETLAAGAELGLVFVRSLLIWLGLAFLSHRLLGPRLAWAIPLASAFPLVWLSHNRWDWTTASVADPLAWGMTALSLLAGTAAIATTPWRWRAARHRATA